MNNYKKKKNIQELLHAYAKKYNNQAKPKGELLTFDLGHNSINQKEEITIYNPTKPIEKNGKKFMLGRVEPINSFNSRAIFFVEDNGKWKIFPHPIFKLEDPFYIENIQGFHILGGVKTSLKSKDEIAFKTVFYRYKTCAQELVENGQLKKPFAESPWGMKDIRLIELSNGKIGVFTRPRGGKAGLGKIAYIEISSLDDLEKEIPRANIIEHLFNEGEWGGANELFLLPNGKIGVLGHIAHFEGKLRHYYALSFIFDPVDFQVFNVEILATAEQFPNVQVKNDMLGGILFSGGMVRKQDGNAELYVGVGDTQAGFINIADPFAATS